jgi:multiple sugar transport system permease protein/sn-glycerol 3-phosphate transport system permease protein
MTAIGQRVQTLPRPARELLTALPFLAPSIVLFGTFVFYPLVKSFCLGFFISNAFNTRQVYVGFDLYREVLTSSSFAASLVVTATFTLYTVLPSIVIATFLAVIANQKLPGIVIFRTIFSSTLAASVAVASVLWLVLLHPTIGTMNEIVTAAGFDEVGWLNDGGWAVGDHSGFGLFTAWFTDPNWALISVSLTTVWMNIGLFTIIILAGLQTIPESLYESARVDGAGRWSQFWHVTLPMLSPTLFFTSVVGVILAFQAFGQIQILTKGGPVDATDTILFSIYDEGFRSLRYGAASVQAVALFFVMLVLTLLQFRLAAGRVFYR